MFSSCRSHIALLTVAGALAAAAICAPSASAATQWYASPNGAGNECSAAKPCKVDFAINYAPAGAEVIVKPGDYYVLYPIANTNPVTIHGVAGQPKPTLHLGNGIQVRLTGAKLTYAEIDQPWPGPATLAASNSTFEQVIVRGSPQADCAAAIFDGTMRDSMVIAQNPTGNAICSQSFQGLNSSSYINVTAVAHSGTAIQAYASGPTASVSLAVFNTIAHAGVNGFGLHAWTDTTTPGARTSMLVAKSNYANSKTTGPDALVAAGSNNQSIPPLFVDPANGDYRQKAGSATIDFGASNLQLGPLDVDGDPRTVGGAPDIGADEFVPPAPGGGSTPPPAGGGGTGSGSGGTGGGGAGSGFAGVKLISTALTLKRGFVAVKLSCPAGTAGRCTGVTKLSARRKRAGSRAARTIGLGRARFSIAAGGQKKLKLRVSRAGRRLFAHRRRLRGRAANAAHDATGLSKTTSARVTIRKGTR